MSDQFNNVVKDTIIDSKIAALKQAKEAIDELIKAWEKLK